MNIFELKQYQKKINRDRNRRVIRSNVFTQDQFNGSDTERKSFLSESKLQKIQYHFQEKQQDYIDEQGPFTNRQMSGFIINKKNANEQKIHFLEPIHVRQKSVNLKSKSSQQYVYDKPRQIEKKPRVVEPSKVDYQRLYKKIKLKPLAEQINQSETIQAKIPQQQKKEISVKNTYQNHMKQITFSHYYPRMRYNNTNFFNSSLFNHQQKSLYQQNHLQDQKNISENIQKSQIQTKKIVEKHDQQLQTSFQDQKVKMIDQQLQTKDVRIFDETKIPTRLNNEQQIQPFLNQSQQQLKSRRRFTNLYQQTTKNQKMRQQQEYDNKVQPFYEEPEKPNLNRSKLVNSKLNHHQQNNQLQEALNHINNQQKINNHVDQQEQKVYQHQYQDPSYQALNNNKVDIEIFDVKIYLKLYYTLKTIQRNLRNPNLLKGIKGYLQLIASGRIDNYEYIRALSNKKKIFKLSLLYERISVIIIAFAYASNTLNESYRYLTILTRYIINNYMVILRLLATEYNKNLENEEEFKQICNLSGKQFQNKGYESVKQNNEIILENIYKLSKYDNLFYQNLKKFIKNSHKFTVQQTFYFILEYFSFFLNICELQHKIPFLAVAPNPYLPQIQSQKYTLVIDILQIMCYSKKYQTFRPYSQYFLDEMAQYYQIVIFSIAFPNQINKLIETVDKKKHIKYKLYKHHAIKSNGIYIKDLSRLGRNMDKIILIDSQNQLNQVNKQNHIQIKSWTGSTKDTALPQLCPILAMIVLKNIDVREALQRYKDQTIRNLKSGVKYINYGMNLE